MGNMSGVLASANVALGTASTASASIFRSSARETPTGSLASRFMPVALHAIMWSCETNGVTQL